MTKSLVSRKHVHGEVEFNDGEFAEIQTVGIDGIEKDLLLQTIQVHRDDSNYSCEQFQHELPVGSWLTICTTIEVTRLDSDTDVDIDDCDQGGKATGGIQAAEQTLLNEAIAPDHLISIREKDRDAFELVQP
jgi:hypothetical protein